MKISSDPQGVLGVWVFSITNRAITEETVLQNLENHIADPGGASRPFLIHADPSYRINPGHSFVHRHLNLP